MSDPNYRKPPPRLPGPLPKPFALEPLVDRLAWLTSLGQYYLTSHPTMRARVHRARKAGGLSLRAVEAAADELGIHPTELWPEWAFEERVEERQVA